MTVADVDWKVLEGMGCRWHLDGMGKYLMGQENFGLDGRVNSKYKLVVLV